MGTEAEIGRQVATGRSIMSFLHEEDSAVILKLYIQPRASDNRFSGLHGGALKLALTAPPIDGKANKALVTFLSRFFRLNKSSVTLIKGRQSRHKTCRLEGLSGENALEIIALEIPAVKSKE